MKKAEGKVYLIGAGPGDPGLLTLRAKECLALADVVVYDRLAEPGILHHCRPDARFVYVGKASSQHTMRQEDINKLLVTLAQEGLQVARLKGGDPLVFGRGGEEALALAEADISFEFVPGISSAIAVAAYAGIPVTHRKVAASFAVITGHEDPAKETSSVKWEKLATATDTLVFLMGVENIEKISAQLMKNGRPGTCPAAIIRWGTHPKQQTWVTILAEAAATVKKYGIEPPAIFLVGEVVRLREKLRWFDNKPLWGQTIIVTRARSQAGTLSRRLRELGAKAVEAPAIKTVPVKDYGPLDRAIASLKEYEWLLFTSVNGVKYFFERLKLAGKDTRALASCKIGAIGTATAAALNEHGIAVDALPPSFRAEGLAEAIAPCVGPGSKILLPRAKEARDVLPQLLAAQGAEIDVIPAYETVMDESAADEVLNALEETKRPVVTFTSSSTVRNLLKLLGPKRSLLKKAVLAAIGPVTAAALREEGLQADICAETYTIEGLIEAIGAYLAQNAKEV